MLAASAVNSLVSGELEGQPGGRVSCRISSAAVSINQLPCLAALLSFAVLWPCCADQAVMVPNSSTDVCTPPANVCGLLPTPLPLTNPRPCPHSKLSAGWAHQRPVVESSRVRACSYSMSRHSWET